MGSATVAEEDGAGIGGESGGGWVGIVDIGRLW